MSPSSARFASLISDGMITGAMRLRLFPTIVKGSADQYVVIRRDTGKMVQTTGTGVESIRLLQDGLTVDSVRAALGRKYGCELDEVDIMPLVECLVNEDFVAEIDGRSISGSKPAIGETLRGMCVAYVRAPLMASMIRRAPLGMTLRLFLRSRRVSNPRLLQQVRENMRRVPAIARPDVDIEQLAAANCVALQNLYYERLLLAALPPAKLDRWLRRRARVDGIAHLDEAIAAGRGAILCAFHVASYSLIPFILAARGYAQTVLMEASVDGALQIRKRIRELQDAGYRYALDPVKLGYGVRGLVRQLERGGIVLLLFDPTIERGREHVEVRFFERSLRVAKGVAWLALRTGAPILPLSLMVERLGRYRLAVHAPLSAECSENEAIQRRAVVTSLSGILERDVLARPQAWLKWKDFHMMVEERESDIVNGSRRGSHV